MTAQLQRVCFRGRRARRSPNIDTFVTVRPLFSGIVLLLSLLGLILDQIFPGEWVLNRPPQQKPLRLPDPRLLLGAAAAEYRFER